MTSILEQVQSDKAQMLKQFREVIYRADIEAILPFLQQFQQGNISILKKVLKQAKRYWYDSKDYPNNVDFNPEHHHVHDEYYRRPYQENRNIVLSLLGFALLNLSDANTTWRLLNFYLEEIIKQDALLVILKQVKPKWLTEYLVIQVRDKDFSHRTYAELKILEQHQLIEFNTELVALSISDVRWLKHDSAQIVLQQYNTDPVIYQRDIPTLFDYETRLFEQWHGSWDNQVFFWHEVFIRLIDEKKLDRLFCIQKILEIQSKDWYSHAKAFFKKIFIAMKVTEDELIAVQDSIFLLLHSEYGVTVNFAIENLKPLIKHVDFHFDEYLTWLASIMPRNDVKNGIKMSLQQMDTALKYHNEHQEDILNLVADTFLQNDFSLQERATKILLKYLKPEYEPVIDKLKMYQDNMMGSLSGLLKIYLEEQNTVTTSETQQNYLYTVPQPHYLNPEKIVQIPQTWQELIFFMGETLQSNSPLDLDILMSAWLLLKPQFPKDYRKQLKSFVKHIEKVSSGSNYKDFFNIFFVEIYDTPEKAPLPKNSRLKWYIKFLSNYYDVLETFAQFSYEEVSVPLLSLPTHAPSYIDPEILVQRLLEYQQKEIQLNLVDLAIALCRTPRENIDAAIKLLPKLHYPQLRSLLSFAFGQTLSPPDLNLHEDFKTVSSTEKNMWRGLWDTVIKTHEQEKKYDKFLDYKFISYYKNFWANDDTRVEYKRDVLFDLPKIKNQVTTYIYPALCYDSMNHGTGGSLDLIFFQHISSVNKTFNDLAYAANGCYSEDILYESITDFIHIFTRKDYILNPYSLFILATYSFNKSKTSRLSVSETFIQCFNQQKINTNILAQHYTTLINSNYAPFSRFIECLNQIKGGSELCDNALIQLIHHIFQLYQIPKELPTGLKKLFELYYELITQYQFTPEQELKTVLQEWYIQFPTLKPIIQKILKQGT